MWATHVCCCSLPFDRIENSSSAWGWENLVFPSWLSHMPMLHNSTILVTALPRMINMHCSMDTQRSCCLEQSSNRERTKPRDRALERGQRSSTQRTVAKLPGSHEKGLSNCEKLFQVFFLIVAYRIVDGFPSTHIYPPFHSRAPARPR